MQDVNGFSQADKNGDGVLDRDEWNAEMQRRAMVGATPDDRGSRGGFGARGPGSDRYGSPYAMSPAHGSAIPGSGDPAMQAGELQAHLLSTISEPLLTCDPESCHSR